MNTIGEVGENTNPVSNGARRISEPRRFAALVVGIFGCTCVSLSSGFNIFSGDLQKAYHFEQSDMSTISTVGIVLAYFGIPYAYIFDYFGLRPVLILGLLLVTSGALLMAFTFSEVIAPSVLKLSIFNGLFNFGTGVYDLACIVPVLNHFPSHKGVVVALLKTYMGLGTGIIAAIQIAYFREDPTNYFYFLTGAGFSLGVVVLLVVRLPPYMFSDYERKRLSDEQISNRLATRNIYLKQKPPPLRFLVGYVILVVLLLFLPTQSLLVEFLHLSWGYQNAFALVVILLMAMSPIVAMPFRWLDGGWCFWRHNKSTDGVTLEHGEEESQEATSAQLCEAEYIAPQYSTRFKESILTCRLWAIFWLLFCTLGSEFVVITNSRFFFMALSGESIDDSFNALLTVLNSTFSAVGRLLMSLLEVWSQKRKPDQRIPITLSLFLPSIFITMMLLLLLVNTNKWGLLLAQIVGALGNGIIAAVTILVVNTIYAKDPGLHYSFCFFATACSSVLLNRVLYGEWYTRKAKDFGAEICLHRSCVQVPLLIMLSLNITTFFTNIYVHLDYLKLSRRVFSERRQVSELQDEEKIYNTPLNAEIAQGECMDGLRMTLANTEPFPAATEELKGTSRVG